MMKHFFRYSLTFLLIALFFTSCNDDAAEVVDLTPPSIANIQHSETVEPGGALMISFKLKDEIGLGEARIDIHDDFDEHAHESARIKATPFAYTNVLDDMRGKKEFTVEETIPIPSDAATGPYHLQIRYFDAAGNEGQLFVSTFEISSESVSPAISITNFEEEEELHSEVSEDGTRFLQLEGTVESRTPGGLDWVQITVEHLDEGGHAHARILHDEPVYNQKWELEGAATFILQDINPAIDFTNEEAGHYELRIVARDVEGNFKIEEREIHVE